MRWIVVFSLSIALTFGLSFRDLSLHQQRVLYDVYQMSKNTKYKWTLVAIAWKESLAGIAQTNIFDGGKGNAACGLFHGLISSVFRRHPEWVPNKFNKNKICTRLILDSNFAFKEAVAELNYWYRKMHGNWFKIWAAYNAGWNFKSKKGRMYARDILRRIRILRRVVGYNWDYRFQYIKEFR